MKKILAFALIFAVVGLIAGCKKTEQPAQTTPQTQQPPQPKQAEQPFKPHKKGNKKNGGGEKKGGERKEALELYNENTLVTTIPGDQYKTLTSASKVHVKNKDFQAILLKDLLKKYKMQGKNVILTGNENTAALTWEQANSNNIYVYLTPKAGLKLYATGGSTEAGLPKKVLRITTSATTEAAKAPAPAKQPAAKKDDSKKSTS